MASVHGVAARSECVSPEDGSESPSAVGGVVAALFVPPADWQHLLISVQSLTAAGITVVTGGPSEHALLEFALSGSTCVVAETGAELVNSVWVNHRLPVLVVSDAVSLPEDFLARALQLTQDDPRVATVSFLSNDAGLLSFPERNQPVSRPPEGHDAVSVTRLLRTRGPRLLPTPIPIAKGAAVLLSAASLGATGGLVTGTATSLDYSLAEYSARSRRHGFVHLLDDTTYYTRHRSPASLPWDEHTVDDMNPVERHALHLDYPMEVSFVHEEGFANANPLALAMRLAKAKVRGLRIVIDGSYLGPHEMGTQVATLATVDALRRRDDVREVVVAVTGPVPTYADRVLTADKVRVATVTNENLEAVGHCEIAHRMLQPARGYSVARWRQVADIVVISYLDLIAYRVGSYHESTEEWSLYRSLIRQGAAEADAITTISDDVKVQVELERLPIDPSRLESIPIGTEHLRGDEPSHIPTELLARGFVDGRFILCLGTNYTHKNRDLALATVAELRRRGWPHALIMAGATIADGSSRLAETKVMLISGAALDHDVYTLPDVTSAERNWLMRYADLVLYPTAAEGFGLVPFEAARFGTPSLFTSFGPMRELGPNIPVVASDWTPDTLATAAERLLSDAELAKTQVEASLEAGITYTWEATAEGLVNLYHRVLAMPPR